MIRSNFVAACLALCGVMMIPDANAQDPRTCPTEFPDLQCTGHSFRTLTLQLDDGGDPCEHLLCLPNTSPMVPVLQCELEDSGIVCQAWPRNPPRPPNVIGPNLPEPILYRWEVSGDISGANSWNESYAAMFRCTAGTASVGIIMLEVMSPYGLTSATSTPVSCARKHSLDVKQSNDPTLPAPPEDPKY